MRDVSRPVSHCFPELSVSVFRSSEGQSFSPARLSVCSELALFDHAVQTDADLAEIRPQCAMRVVQVCEELGVRVMVEHVSDAVQRFGCQVLLHQLQQ